MKRLVLLGLILVSACGPSGKTGPTGGASSSVSSSPSSPASVGSASVTFACRLPISLPSSGPSGGFVTFPSGELTTDPNSAFQSIGNRLRTIAQPYLYGSKFSGQATFTRRYGRWLPASVAAVSPDSSHYAYWEFTDGNSANSRVHDVDVASATDRVVYSQGFYAVMDYRAEGIYLARTSPMGEGQYGLWLLNPSSGSLRAVGSPNQMFSSVDGGAAWYGDMAPGDQAPPLMFPMDRLLRLDIKSGVVTTWFHQPGRQVQVIGFDGQGHPVVWSSDGLSSKSVQLWLVVAPGASRQIYSQPDSVSVDFIGGFSAPLADAHGLWFGSSKGIFLYTADGKFEKVSAAAGEIAGRCS
jgi:hypothetical protein